MPLQTAAEKYKAYQDAIDENKKKQLNLSLEPFKDQVEFYGNRAYKKPDLIEKIDGEEKTTTYPFPWQLKCSSADYRILHFCIEPRFLDPSARIYFDTGKDEDDEIDIFNDGNLNFSLNFVSLYIPLRFGRGEFYDNWSWGPMAGIGIGSTASDSEDDNEKSSGAPIVLLSYGFMTEYKIGDTGASFGVEAGRAIGISTDESFGDRRDSATFVGLKINIPFGEKKEPAAPVLSQ